MKVQRSERFDTDVERQFRWYLLETDLDPLDAIELAERFADAVDETLERLRQSPFLGRSRLRMDAELAGTRSWRVAKPFHRFLIFYRVTAQLISAERLLEGRTELVGGN